MPYCVNCGAENEAAARFCKACGQPVTQSQQETGLQATQRTADGGAKMLILAGMGLYGLAALMVLMAGNTLGFVVSLIMIGVIYFAAYAPLAEGENTAAANGAAIAGGISLALGFVNLIMGATFPAIFVFIIAAVLGLAWNQAKG